MARFWKLHSRCPEDHFSEEKLPEKKLFLNFPFRVLIENTLTFPEKILADFKKKRSTCPEEQSVESCESKKAMKPKLFAEFFDKSRAFGGNFPADLSKLHSTCRANFWGKWINRYSRVWIWLVTFLDIERKLSRVWRNFLRKFHKTAFYMSEGETLVLSNFWRENFDCENFFNF